MPPSEQTPPRGAPPTRGLGPASLLRGGPWRNLTLVWLLQRSRTCPGSPGFQDLPASFRILSPVWLLREGPAADQAPRKLKPTQLCPPACLRNNCAGLQKHHSCMQNHRTCLRNHRAWQRKRRAGLTLPAASSNAATICSTDVPFPVPRLYTTQPAPRAASGTRQEQHQRAVGTAS